MTNLNAFIDELASCGVTLVAEGEQLRIRARQGVLTADLRDRITANKADLLTLLHTHHVSSSDAPLPAVTHNSSGRYKPFPLTDIQHAYWVGRSDLMELGNTAVHAYIEIENEGMDVAKMSDALNALIQRHDMLRMIIESSGEQRVLESVPIYRIDVTEFATHNNDDASKHLDDIRALMSNQMLATDKWPLFDIRATRYGKNRVRLHVSLDILMADLWSLFRFFSEWRQLYNGDSNGLAPLEITFRDYVFAEKALEAMPSYQASRSYWLARLDKIYPAPDLPLAKQPASISRPHFVRRSHGLDKNTWENLRKKAGGLQITPSGLLLSAFAEVLTAWSKSPRFTLNLTLFNRLPMHPQVNNLVGDFTTTILLAIDGTDTTGFQQRAQRTQQRLYADLEHRVYNGVRVVRDLSQRRAGMPGAAAMPVVFSSALGLNSIDSASTVTTQLGSQLGDVVYTITQTPQVWIDHQVFENNGELSFNWDVVEDLFPNGMMDAMFDAYCEFLHSLAKDDAVWSSDNALSIAASQIESRELANNTAAPLSKALLHELVWDAARMYPDSEAVIDSRRRMTYSELATESYNLAQRLHLLGAKPNTLVAVVLEKGWEQIVAVLGILNAGAAYLPVDPDLPASRRNHLLAHGEVVIVVTCMHVKQRIDWPESVTVVCVDDSAMASTDVALALPKPKQCDLAYVIYTSGSTGTPKGVAIEHQAAVNTILDINKRYSVDRGDSVLAVSALGFDLSVYDIFGVLSAGGKIVLPDSVENKDAAHWWSLVKNEEITLWNSVPVLFQMLLDHLDGSGKNATSNLRLALLSGDWIPLNLPERVRSRWKNLQLISLGGATEASIWSICYPIQSINPEWHSVPYGKPLANQNFHVLDEKLRPCPLWVPGQLYIGGAGLAREYWRDEEKTRQSFIIHPDSGERLYRTGDLGRYLADGNIEFLGRADYQVKVNGYRIELGEIETALKTCPGIKDAVVSALGEMLGEKRLVAYIVPDQIFANAEEEIKRIRQYLSERLPFYMVPVLFVSIESVPLTVNGKIDRKALPKPAGSSVKPSVKTVPRNRGEEQMAQMFTSTLKLQSVGIHDSFFELGGDSLLATRLVANAGRAFEVELHLRDLFKGPTVAEFAARVVELRRSRHEPVNAEQNMALLEEEGEL